MDTHADPVPCHPLMLTCCCCLDRLLPEERVGAVARVEAGAVPELEELFMVLSSDDMFALGGRYVTAEYLVGRLGGRCPSLFVI